MAKVNYAEMPRQERATRKTLPDATLDEAVADLTDSVDFRPHAYTDGTEYKTYSECLSAANLTIREAARKMGKPENMFRRRVWDTKGEKDRKKNGKWVFAVSQRSTPPKARTKTEDAQPAAA